MTERTLNDLFHLVRQVIPEDQELITFGSEKKVDSALALMLEKNLSQIPVVEGSEVLGVFSFRSFADGVRKLPKNETNILSLPVEEFVEDLGFAQITDELPKLIDELDIRDAVLVGTHERLQGIVTTVDALKYFYQVASAYVILQEIELSMRELIRASVNQAQLEECLEKSLGAHYKGLGRELPTNLEQLTFNDYVMLLRYKGTWEKFQSVFGGTSNTTYTRLEKIPTLRNDVFHFKRDLTVEDYDRLRDTRDWLFRRIRKAKAIKEGFGHA